MSTTKFEKSKKDIVLLLSTASLPTNQMEPSQYNGLALLASHLRAELYSNGEHALIKTEIIEEFDKAIKRLFG